MSDEYPRVAHYLWQGWPAKCEFFDAREERIDVTAIRPEHDTGIIPEGELHVLVEPTLVDNRDGFWTKIEEFEKHTEPLSPAAINYAEGDDE